MYMYVKKLDWTSNFFWRMYCIRDIIGLDTKVQL